MRAKWITNFCWWESIWGVGINKAGYTASGTPKHLYKRVNEKAQRTKGPTDRRTDGRTDPLIEVFVAPKNNQCKQKVIDESKSAYGTSKNASSGSINRNRSKWKLLPEGENAIAVRWLRRKLPRANKQLRWRRKCEHESDQWNPRCEQCQQKGKISEELIKDQMLLKVLIS